jgi:hypothetical protein
MTVQSVRRGGPIETPGPASDNLPFTHMNNRLHIMMPPLSKAGEFTFTIRYRGTPAAGLRIGPNMHGDRTFFGENWPNLVRNWLPMIDHPYDKATGEFVITAPNQYQVVANGLLIEELDLPNNMRRSHWKQSVPIASWLYTIAVARFSSLSGRSVTMVGETSARHPYPDAMRRALIYLAVVLPLLLVTAPALAAGIPPGRYAIGDSVMLGAKPQLQARGFTVDARKSRQFSDARNSNSARFRRLLLSPSGCRRFWV